MAGKMKYAKVRIGRKAIDPITGLAIVIIVGVLIMEAFYSANMVISTESIRQDARETMAISVINGMDFLKRTMQEGVTYATERATYDVLAKGGYDIVPTDLLFSNGEAYWRKYGQTFVPDFGSNLVTAVAAHFQSYGDDYGSSYSLLGQGVSLSVPTYSSCGIATVTDNGNSVGVSIMNSCTDKLQAYNDFMTVTEDNANFIGDVPVNVFSLVASAKAAFIDADPVYGAIVAGESSTSCKSVSTTDDSCVYSGDSATVGEALLAAKCSDWVGRLRSAIVTQLSKIGVSGATASFDIPASGISAQHTVESCDNVCTPATTSYTCAATNPTDCSSCGSNCALTPVYEEVTRYRCGTSGSADSCDQCPVRADCTPYTTVVQTGSECTCTVVGYTTSCTYSYKADADVEITLQPASQQYYPIYDATSKFTLWTKMQLKFMVLDGNLAYQPTISTTTTTTSSTTTTLLYSCPTSGTRVCEPAAACIVEGPGAVCDNSYTCAPGLCCCYVPTFPKLPQP